MQTMEELRGLVEKKENTVENIFNKQPLPNENTKHIDDTDELVDNVFKQAVVTQVQTDGELQTKVLGTAKKFTETKMEVIKNRVDKEDKQAFFENNESACECFGYDEKDTEKWAVKYMKIWHTIMTAIWISIGWVTYAPVAFIAKKIGVIFRKTWIAVLIAIILYFGITLSPIWLKWIATLVAT